MVRSLTGYLLSAETEIHEQGFKNALSGNLCRCTGDASINRGYQSLIQYLGNTNLIMFTTDNFGVGAIGQSPLQNQVLDSDFKLV